MNASLPYNTSMSNVSPNSPGVLLVGHGTRDARGQNEFRQAAEMLQRALPEVPVEGCFLELAAPDISAGSKRLAARGARSWVVAPALLFAAAHAKRDIPELVAAALAEQAIGPIQWAMAEPLGSHEQLLELSAERFHAAFSAEADPQRTMLIMVGRGTSDAEAIAEMRKFTALRAELTPVAAHETAFLTGAKPHLDDALQAATDNAHTHIVVQPHLLWRGQLVDEIAAAVARVQASDAGRRKQWAIAAHLGPQPEVIQALADRIQQCYTTVTAKLASLGL